MLESTSYPAHLGASRDVFKTVSYLPSNPSSVTLALGLVGVNISLATLPTVGELVFRCYKALGIGGNFTERLISFCFRYFNAEFL